MSNSLKQVVLLPGDGIGPEISNAIIQIFESAGVPIQWIHAEAGLSAYEKTGEAISQQTLDLIKEHQIALKGPTTTPVGKGHKSINVTIRKALNLYANVRPSKSIPGVNTPFKNINLIVVRENIEDTYGGIEHMQSPDVAQCLRLITRPGSERVARYAFEMAAREGRKKVTCVHKANIMKITDGLFLESFQKISRDYPQIEASDIIVDNCCMQLVTKPEQFDVMVLPNLFGDIVSDLCAGLIGGLGVAGSANIGKNCAVFEAVHGSAPDIAGRGIANPTALLTSALSMLRHMGLLTHANRIEQALMTVLNQQEKRTGDLGGKANTKEFTMHICKELQS